MECPEFTFIQKRVHLDSLGVIEWGRGRVSNVQLHDLPVCLGFSYTKNVKLTFIRSHYFDSLWKLETICMICPSLFFLHEMSNPVFLGKVRKIFQYVVC